MNKYVADNLSELEDKLNNERYMKWFEENDFNSIYMNLSTWLRPFLTYTLLRAGINPLDHLNIIPDHFLDLLLYAVPEFEDIYDKVIEIPENIGYIDGGFITNSQNFPLTFCKAVKIRYHGSNTQFAWILSGSINDEVAYTVAHIRFDKIHDINFNVGDIVDILDAGEGYYRYADMLDICYDKPDLSKVSEIYKNTSYEKMMDAEINSDYYEPFEIINISINPYRPGIVMYVVKNKDLTKVAIVTNKAIELHS